jgi:hypothetical protein
MTLIPRYYQFRVILVVINAENLLNNLDIEAEHLRLKLMTKTCNLEMLYLNEHFEIRC